MVVSAARVVVVSAAAPTPLQLQVLRACPTWRRPADLRGIAAEPYHLLARLVRLGWLEKEERAPQRLRRDRGKKRRRRVYRISAAGAAILASL